MSIPSISPYSLADALPAEPTGTPAVLDWQLERDRAALLVHDMQQYFLAAYQQDAEPISTVVRNLQQLIEQADAAGVPVFYSPATSGTGCDSSRIVD